MGFCVECGAKQPDQAKFCLACGKPVAGEVVQSANLTPVEYPASNSAGNFIEPSPKPKKPLNKAVIIAGGVVALVVVIMLSIVSGSKTLTLDKTQAQELLMSKSDFPFDAKRATGDGAYTIAQAKLPLFNSQDSCTEDGEFADLIKSDGTLLASVDFDESAEESSFTHFDEDIVEFSDSATALKALELAKAAYENPNCEYDADDWESTISGASDAQATFGIGGSDSFYFEYDWVYSSDLVDLSQNSDTIVVVNGPYVIVLQGSTDPSTGTVSRESMHESMKIALEKIFR